MNISNHTCPGCKRSDALGRFRFHDGRWVFMCHATGREGHRPGRRLVFDEKTGVEIAIIGGMAANIAGLQASGVAFAFRDFSAWFLESECGITLISANDLDRHTASTMPALGSWGRSLEEKGLVLSQLPIYCGPRPVGMQFRAFPPDSSMPEEDHHIRVFGSADGLYLPGFIGINPKAVIIHEGPWGAVAANHDAMEFQDEDIFSLATLSSGVSAFTIKTTLDAIFPGIPRFSLFDQDPAGIFARMATSDVAKPILITGAGPGKDYRDLRPGVRFERLSEIVCAELKAMVGPQ